MNVVSALLAATSLLTSDPVAGDDQVRSVVQRSLPFIQAEGQRWIEEKKCVTCHQVPFMVWALNTASDRGFDVDHQKLAETTTWATDWKHMATKEQLKSDEAFTLSQHPDAVAQMLLGRSARKLDAGAPAWPALFAERLAAGQHSDGHWKAGGQLPGQKRPERETHEVTTMWAMVALNSYSRGDDTLRSRFANARSWLANKTEGQSTEWWVARLLLERGEGNAFESERIRAAILERQRDDGGWGWLCSDISDAFGCGLALYGLSLDGMQPDHPAIARGRRFLASSQQADGSWQVNGTKKAKSKQVEATSTYWGTCWAVIGLVETLPHAASQDEVAGPK